MTLPRTVANLKFVYFLRLFVSGNIQYAEYKFRASPKGQGVENHA